MADRSSHAAPKCPRCGDGPTKAHNTRHTVDGQIVRYRICDCCGWRFWTRQHRERVIDPGKVKVIIPPWRDPASKNKLIVLEQINA